MTLRAFSVRVAVLAIAAVVLSSTVHVGSISPAGPVSIPFERINGHIVLTVSVNKSRPLPFIFDTGAKPAIIKLDRAKELGLRLEGEVQGGGVGPGINTGSFVRDATFTVTGVTGFSQALTMALPLANLAPTHGQDIDGIIGTDFIRQFVVEVDYQARRITLHDKATFTYAGPGESFPIRFNSDGNPLVTAEVTPVGGKPLGAAFLFDTGSSLALVLHSPFVRSHQLPGPNADTIRPTGGGAGGQTTGRFGRVAELKIGKFRIDRPPTLFSEDKAGAFANPEAAGNIGGQIASRFKVFLDYGRNRIILEPSSTLGDPFDRAVTGVALRAEGPAYRTFRVTQVSESSPGSEAGLQKGDVLTAIDGTPADQLTLNAIIELFARPVAYALTIQRGADTIKTTLTPRRLR